MIITHDEIASLPPDLVLVGGCFDPLHAGHVSYLETAATFGPVICAVAPDAYIASHKGRPCLLPLAVRLAVVNALDTVAFVIAQDDSGEAGALEDIRPKFYAKGRDWLGHLPEAIDLACQQFGVVQMFLESATLDSSTTRLLAWRDAYDRVLRLSA